VTHIPFALSLSKGVPSSGKGEGEGFDKLSPNGFLFLLEEPLE
jgi:hypothetical protein